MKTSRLQLISAVALAADAAWEERDDLPLPLDRFGRVGLREGRDHELFADDPSAFRPGTIIRASPHLTTVL